MKTYFANLRLRNGRSLRCLFLLLFVFSAAYEASGITRYWTGEANANWSNPGNWKPAGIPQNGDILAFSKGKNHSSVNDLVDLQVWALVFDLYSGDGGFASLPNGDFTISGNPIHIKYNGSYDWAVFTEDDVEYHITSHAAIWAFGGATGGIVGVNPVINCPIILDSHCEFNVNGFDGSSGGNSLHFNGNIDLNGHDLDLTATLGRNELAGVISGIGDVDCHPNGEYDGSVEFQGGSDNTFTGNLYIEDNGTYLNKVAGSAAYQVVVTPFASITWRHSNQLVDDATVICSGGQVLLNGYNETIGTLWLTNKNNTLTNSIVDTGGGKLTVSANILASNYSDSNTPILRGRIEFPSGTHAFDISGTAYAGLDVQAELTGSGNFNKIGNAALILSASNSCNSSISINQGILDVRHNRGLGDAAGSTAINGGNLTLRNVSIQNETLFALNGNGSAELPGAAITVIGAATWSGQIILNTNLTVVGGDMALSGPISGPGGLGCFSLGTMTLTGTTTNTYTGKTLVRCPLLQLNKPSGVNAFAGPLEVGGGFGGTCEVRWLNSYQSLYAPATLFANGLLNLNNLTEDLGPITFNGGNIQTGNGELGIYGLVTANESNQLATISGSVGLPAGNREFRVLGDIFNSSGLSINASIVGPGNLIKTGGGILQLSGANTYSGLTKANEGLLSITSATALGAGGDASTFVADGATVQLNSIGATPVPERISIQGRGVGFGLGALDVIGQAQLRNQFPSIYACLDLTTNATVSIFQAGSKLVADGFVSGPGSLTKTGAGTLVYTNNNANTYSGATTIEEGMLELRKPNNIIAVPGPLVLGPSTTARWYETGGMPGNGSVTANGNSLVDLNGNNQSLTQLNLIDGGSVQTGAGTLQFTGGGAINIGTSNSPFQGLRQSASITGKVLLPSLDDLNCNVINFGPAPLTSEPELAISANISGTGNLKKNGGGALRLTGNNTFDGTSQFYSGEVDVYGGTVIVGSATALGGISGQTYVANGASLALINNITVANETLVLDSTNNAALDNRGGNNTWSGQIQFSRNSTINVALGWALNCSGIISGSGSLTKWGPGGLLISGSGNNSYNGGTMVNAGTLLLAKPTAVTAVPAYLIVGQSDGGGAPAIARNATSYQIFGNIFVNSQGLYDVNGQQENTDYLGLNGNARVETGAGFLSLKTGASVAVTPGTNTTATINGHILMDTGTHLFTVDSGATLPGTNDLLINAQIDQISTAAGIQKAGAGSMRLVTNNTYTGTTTISGGTLQVDGSQPQSPVQISGARLQGNGTVGHITFGGIGTERLAPGGSPGFLVCSNFNATGAGGGTLELELNGSTPGSGYDLLSVRGSVNLTGLKLSGSLGFQSAVGNQFTIIINDGSDPVVGTFSGLPQNGKIYIGGELFQINYSGGSGNDVVLSRLVTPPPPVLTIAQTSPNSVILRWPTNDPPFRLVSATNLLATNWTQTLPLPSVVGANNMVTNALNSTANFYRLVNP